MRERARAIYGIGAYIVDWKYLCACWTPVRFLDASELSME
jgi:hypothetical protein